MEHSRQPSKESVRQWLQTRQQERKERKPLPDPQQIRRELGWDLVRLERGDLPCR
ncbi:hypothetical protein HSX11_19690 [Oxalobacteraceae bacterium]|nr:hypothetical protein [Oxalobacteraceae bacterium]